MPVLTARSFFAGIGGFDIGFEATKQIAVLSQIEWDKHCQKILKRNYPHVELFGDISGITGRDLCEATGPEVWVGGFPCQDTSIAAPNRLGLQGERSKHFYQFVRLVQEYQRLLAQRRPEWVVFENPTGVLASPGKCTAKRPCFEGCTCGVDKTGWDMAAVTRCLDELGYGWSFRVVDGRFFPLPNGRHSPAKRERVLVVGHRSGDPRIARAVLGDAGEGNQTHPASAVGRRPVGPAPSGGAAFGTIWRKSARPRASLEKGGYETWVADGWANTLTGFDWGAADRQTHLLTQDSRIRTFTLTEWERLAGFPDGHTSGTPDSARGQMLGNSMHPGMAMWLGNRLVDVQQQLEAA